MGHMEFADGHGWFRTHQVVFSRSGVLPFQAVGCGNLGVGVSVCNVTSQLVGVPAHGFVAAKGCMYRPSHVQTNVCPSRLFGSSFSCVTTPLRLLDGHLRRRNDLAGREDLSDYLAEFGEDIPTEGEVGRRRY
jgi:hypothetical protein